jgi:RecA-family ATPase
MKTVAVTVFPNYAAVTKREESLSLEALAERIRTTSAPAKEDLPWLKFARFGPLPNPKSKSGSLRWNGNVQRLSGVLADYDGEQITPGEAAEKLDKAGISGLIYTSPSHMLNGHGPRWRAACPFSKELPPDRHYQMVSRLNGLFGGALATESFVLSQCYYFGSVNGNPAHEAIVVDGTATLDQCDELDESAIGKPNGDGKVHASAEPEAPIEDTRAALALIPNPVPSWGRNASWIEWNNLGMAVWRASGGSDEGFVEFDKWSRQSPKYDPDETEFRWRHYFDSPPTAIGFGTLVHWAREIKPDLRPPSKAQSQATPLWTDVPLSDWADREIPPRQWIMEGWIPVGQCIGFYGLAGILKTDWLLQLMMAASLGLPFCGIPIMHCITYGLFCEDNEEEVARRAQRIAAFYGRSLSEFTGLNFASLVGVLDTEFVSFDTGRMLLQPAYHLFAQRVSQCGANLAVLDTAPDFFGGEEINRRQVSRFVRMLDGIGMQNHCAIVFSAHPSQRGRASGRYDSGSTGWEGKVRGRLVLRDPIDDQDDEDYGPRRIVRPPSDKRILTRAKSNYAIPGEEIELVVRDGGFAPTALEATKRGPRRDLAANAKFLELLRKFAKQGRWVHDAASSPERYAPAAFAADLDHADFTKPEFKRAMTRLFDANRIKKELVGSGRNGHYQLIEINQ